MRKITGVIVAMVIAAMSIAGCDGEEERRKATENVRRAAQAEGIRIEQEAVIGHFILDKSIRRAPRSMIMGLRGAIDMIEAHGWRCDSVSVWRYLVMSRGFEIQCNLFAYDYIIEDRGGQWTMRLD